MFFLRGYSRSPFTTLLTFCGHSFEDNQRLLTLSFCRKTSPALQFPRRGYLVMFFVSQILALKYFAEGTVYLARILEVIVWSCKNLATQHPSTAESSSCFNQNLNQLIDQQIFEWRIEKLQLQKVELSCCMGSFILKASSAQSKKLGYVGNIERNSNCVLKFGNVNWELLNFH